jgi:hypothetical protein
MGKIQIYHWNMSFVIIISLSICMIFSACQLQVKAEFCTRSTVPRSFSLSVRLPSGRYIPLHSDGAFAL